ncbi:mismatch-specific DNA-glycosylase [Sulfobacillus sp. DSM 109850]|uniref:Mismatch-specific DNA-glycosylase n=2 Tax=Sulfobacillus harzensis TaxID=2729629 RepID=A0A7Y0Q2N1_9FIRM|nr:mismatch-specific DNA-glycosylase [Sulfobacillus harzensis]NMP22081.1 mismatch-specific DNA-glycosylase [Sulfobacillus harzensis]
MEHLDVLFVGYNPGMRSEETGHHFAGPGNLFWALLADSGLTGQRLTFEQDRELLFWRIGIVNLVDRPTPGTADLDPIELLQGGLRCRARVDQLRPKVVAFLGKEIFRYYRQMSKSAPITWGIQPDGLVAGVWEAVLPNPSRRSTMAYELRLRYFREVKQLSEWGPHPRP